MIDYNGQVLSLCPWPAVRFSSPILLNRNFIYIYMIVEWNDRALAAVERQPETYQSARGDTRTKLPPRSWEWSAACFLLLVTPYFDVTCTWVTRNMWNVTFNVRIGVCRTCCHLILYWTSICPDKYSYPSTVSGAVLYSVAELSARRGEEGQSFMCTSDVTNTARSPQSPLQCENWHYTCRHCRTWVVEYTVICSSFEHYFSNYCACSKIIYVDTRHA